jgi:hypothetical protein
MRLVETAGRGRMAAMVGGVVIDRSHTVGKTGEQEVMGALAEQVVTLGKSSSFSLRPMRSMLTKRRRTNSFSRSRCVSTLLQGSRERVVVAAWEVPLDGQV